MAVTCRVQTDSHRPCLKELAIEMSETNTRAACPIGKREQRLRAWKRPS